MTSDEKPAIPADPDRVSDLVSSLRDPVHAVVGLAEVLAGATTAIEPDDPTSRVLFAEAQRLASVVDELLAEFGSNTDGDADATSLEVLVVDDSLVNQLLTASQLEKLGHRAVVVSSGQAAIDHLAGSTPDCVLMDWHMPAMDGLETARHVRAHEQSTGADPIPIIALTARAMIGDREQCLAAGMNDFLPKPVSLMELDAMLARWTDTDADAHTDISTDIDSEPAESSDPAAGSTGADEPLIDRSYLDSLKLDIGVEAFERLRDSYIGELTPRSTAIRDSARSGDWTTVQRTAHTLKSTSVLLGATRLADLAKRLEHAIHDGAPDQALAKATVECAIATQSAFEQVRSGE